VGDGTGNCDSANAIGGLARENYPNCTKADTDIDNLDSECKSIDNFKFDWSFYLEFYGGLTRRDYMNPVNRFNSKRRKCRETNMISCAIEYLVKPPRPVTPGGAKRRKATKKRTRKTKSKNRAHKTKRTHRR
jgi:hypothetical protein